MKELVRAKLHGASKLVEHLFIESWNSSSELGPELPNI